MIMHDGGADGPWPLAVVHAMLPFKEIGPRRQYVLRGMKPTPTFRKKKEIRFSGVIGSPKAGGRPIDVRLPW